MIKGLENIVTIVGKGGEVFHGMLEPILNPDGSYKGEFWFSHNGKLYQRIWCKEDYWQVRGIAIGKLVVTNG